MVNINIKTKYLSILLLTILLSSCASLPSPEYRPQRDGYLTASWYGQDFHGRPTSSGERYDMYGLTCAHKEMPFGTRLRVTNPDTDKSVVVTVNDRGPFIAGRDLDLSYGAAREIEMANKGVGRVKIEHLGRDMRYVKRIAFSPSLPSGAVTIQLGSFTEKANADRLKQGLELKYDSVYLATFFKDDRTFYRVRMGRYDNRDNAYTIASRLADEGYTALIVSY
ncbi:MAG: septal ring lytic transglycosylase RlpA family protein [Nitrospirae bacterium]|nr:septal ring lytic transglycosylase RlpA family protein [Nitrospirota bacterium]